MILEIKSILKNKISVIIFLIFLMINMVQLTNYVGCSYDVEQNMTLFESQMEIGQEMYSQIKLKYTAINTMPDDDRFYWDNYLEYLNWSIQNAKDGWNLFNTYGDSVFTNNKLYKKYSRITLWDKLYYLDSLKEGADKEFINQVKKMGVKEPKINFDKNKIYVLGSQFSVDKKEDFNEKKLSIQEQLHDLKYGKNKNTVKGPWAFLRAQLRKDSQLPFVYGPLCIVFSVVIILEQKKNGILELARLSNKHWITDLYLKLFISFFTISFASILVPVILLSLQNGISGLNAWILVDTKNMLKFSTYTHGENYILNNLSEYYLSLKGFTPNLTYIELWKALLICCPLMILKTLFFVSVGVFCSLLFNEKWKTYILGIIIILLNGFSQNLGLLPCINPFSVISCLCVLCGCGYQSWLNGLIIIALSCVALIFINSALIKRKDCF